ncbi:Zn-dependent hydrolase, glyoxylase [Idiomarina sp. A28L]|uniref:MBL fold metallo-hydrolase n=1 Tax=Idiomarina sp. A28L TaxID=1036674 RepID=UPI00021388C1|nr:MBL fold metallo-hydrolase [Idiomarina sp. A28L]EGN74899.1 Zn-dependent hydrolase, glyoxylase [Idiomarina sp. A28L]
MNQLRSYLFSVVAVAAMMVVPAQAQEVNETKLTEGVYMLEGQGGTMMLVTTETRTVLIDAQYAQMAERIGAKVGELGHVPLTYLINTHFHGDHVGGNGYMGSELGAKIIAHKNVRTRLEADEDFDAAGLPTILADNSLTLDLGGHTLTLVHYPTAHTDGDMVIWVEGENIVHLGDLFFVDRFPFIDLSAGGTVQGFIDAIADLLVLLQDDTQIVAGHGGLASKRDLQRVHDMIVATQQQVKDWQAAGAGVDNMVDTGLAEEWESWSWNFINEDRWIRTLYNDLNPRSE